MIREERDPAFWDHVIHHPEVARVALGPAPDTMADLIKNPLVTPLAAEHGGFLFVRLDSLGRVCELHSMFTPEGWGREAMVALVEAIGAMFDTGMQVLTTYEVEGQGRTRPPVRLGFEPAGDFAPAAGGSLRTWVLTAEKWRDRPSTVGVH